MKEKVLEAVEDSMAVSPAGSDDDDYELLFGHKRAAETPVPESKRNRVEVKIGGFFRHRQFVVRKQSEQR